MALRLAPPWRRRVAVRVREDVHAAARVEPGRGVGAADHATDEGGADSGTDRRGLADEQVTRSRGRAVSVHVGGSAGTTAAGSKRWAWRAFPTATRRAPACQGARNSPRVGEGNSPHLLASKEVPDVDSDGAACHISGHPRGQLSGRSIWWGRSGGRRCTGRSSSSA